MPAMHSVQLELWREWRRWPRKNKQRQREKSDRLTKARPHKICRRLSVYATWKYHPDITFLYGSQFMVPSEKTLQGARTRCSVDY